jgi:hypothetical protein
VLISVPYFPTGFGLPSLVPLLDRNLYPADRYPDGQWDYYRFYLTHFDQSVSDMEADIPATLASLYRPGNPAFAAAAGKISPSALITANRGRYGPAHRAPPTTPDTALWPPADFDAVVTAFRATGFRPANAWYLNDAAGDDISNRVERSALRLFSWLLVVEWPRSRVETCQGLTNR